jgi:hypothetical protein
VHWTSQQLPAHLCWHHNPLKCWLTFAALAITHNTHLQHGSSPNPVAVTEVQLQNRCQECLRIGWGRYLDLQENCIMNFTICTCYKVLSKWSDRYRCFLWGAEGDNKEDLHTDWGILKWILVCWVGMDLIDLAQDMTCDRFLWAE